MREFAVDRAIGALARQEGLASHVSAEVRSRLACVGTVSPHELGQIYEQLVGEIGRKETGRYYTPPHLVRFVLRQTLRPALAQCRTYDEVKALRIADLSCGGGAFLIEVLFALEAACMERGLRSGMSLRRSLSRCLVGIDIDKNALAVTSAALELACGGGHRALLLHGDGLLPSTFDQSLDLVVGNPPWGQKNLRFDAATKERYRGLFRTARGVWDPFKLFVERSLGLVREEGRVGLVLPDILLLKNLTECRELILEQSAIESIAHCGKAFADVNLDAIAVSLRRTNSVPRNHRVAIWPKLGEDLQPASHHIEQKTFHALPDKTFNLQMHGARYRLYRSLDQRDKVGDFFEMHEGVHTGNRRRALIVDTGGQGCKRIVVGGRELSRYRMDWAGAYLDTRSTLVDRDRGQYANLGRSDWFERPKLVVRRTGDKILAAFDPEGLHVTNNLFVVFPGAPMPEREMRAMVCYLNSRFATWYFRTLVPRRGRAFAELKLKHLRRFPVPPRVRWEACVDELAELEERHRSSLADASDALRVDELVETALEISPRHRQLITLES